MAVTLSSTVSLERVDTDWLAFDRKSTQAHRLSGPAALVIDALIAEIDLPAGLEAAVESLLEKGILTSSDDRWTRRRVLTTGTAVAAAVGVSSLVLPSAAAATSGEVSPQAVSGTITNTAGFTSPLSVAIGSVWVTNHNGDSLSRVDPVTGSILATYTYGTGVFVKPFGVAVGFGSIWVPTNVATDSVYYVRRIDPATGNVIASIAVGTQPMFVAAAFGSIWVTNHNSANIAQSSTVSRIDPATNTVVATISGVSRPIGIAASSNHVWVANNLGEFAKTVSKIDPSDNSLSRITLDTGPVEPYGVAMGFGSIWVTGHITGSLYRIDPSTDAVTKITNVGNGSRGIAAGSDSMWVTHYNSGTVSRINPSTNTVTATYTVGTTPWGIAADANGVWVANFGSNSVSKIIP
jgi:YVTN family beta-propeller protein